MNMNMNMNALRLDLHTSTSHMLSRTLHLTCALACFRKSTRRPYVETETHRSVVGSVRTAATLTAALEAVATAALPSSGQEHGQDHPLTEAVQGLCAAQGIVPYHLHAVASMYAEEIRCAGQSTKEVEASEEEVRQPVAMRCIRRFTFHPPDPTSPTLK